MFFIYLLNYIMKSIPMDVFLLAENNYINEDNKLNNKLNKKDNR